MLTGKNGSGKTQLINLLHNFLEKRIVQQKNDFQELTLELKKARQYSEILSKSDANYDLYFKSKKELEAEIQDILNPIIETSDIELLIANYNDGKVVCLKFEATRQAKIENTESVKSIESLKQQNSSLNKSDALYFEQYLVSYKIQQAYANSKEIGNNQQEAENIQVWFNKLEYDFRALFEDDQLSIEFYYKNQRFLIHQLDKEPYGFQQLSSGFSSILAVYAELLTKIRLRDLTPDELKGIVLIDEIDAHLHPSLQRKIFSFLTHAFPNIQFIIATHSPFVVSSVDNAVIFVLSTLQAVNENLFMYSYEAILEGLFNILPSPEMLSDKINQIGNLISKENIEINELKNSVHEIEPYEEKIDPESLMFLKKAQLLIKKTKRIIECLMLIELKLMSQPL
ncbi:MAG: AAA family ATPase [Snodgrassella alvi]